MKHNFAAALVVALLACNASRIHSQTTIDTPALSGTVTSVQTINTAKLLTLMSTGRSNLVLVAAHRGYWINAPENSGPALQAAFNSGVEAIEIDLRTTSDNVLVVSHDADLLKETDGNGFINQTPYNGTSTLKGIENMHLRDRKGNVQSNLSILTFAGALSILGGYQTQTNGPVLIVDLKDGSGGAWAEYLNALQVVQGANLPNPAAVVFKMKMRDISTDASSGILAQSRDHPYSGHILATVNPEDATNNCPGAQCWGPTSANFQTVYGLSTTSPYFLQQFELNINVAGDGASLYTGKMSGPLASYATYYESKFYPEGVSTIYGGNRVYNPPAPQGTVGGTTLCCYMASLAPNPTNDPPAQDLRGLLDFSLYYNQSAVPGTSLITTDNLNETLNYLVSLGQRNVSAIQ